MGEMPSQSPIQRPSSSPAPTEPRLKAEDDSAGTANCPSAFNTPIAWAAKATTSRKGNIIRVSRTANSCLPGVLLKPLAKPSTRGEANTIPRMHNAPTTRASVVATRFVSRMADSRVSCARRCVNTGTKALESAPSANKSRVRLGMRKPSV